MTRKVKGERKLGGERDGFDGGKGENWEWREAGVRRRDGEERRKRH